MQKPIQTIESSLMEGLDLSLFGHWWSVGFQNIDGARVGQNVLLVEY